MPHLKEIRGLKKFGLLAKSVPGVKNVNPLTIEENIVS